MTESLLHTKLEVLNVKYSIVIPILFVFSSLAFADSKSELIRNSAFWERSGSNPSHWSVNVKPHRKNSVSFPIRSRKKKVATCKINTANCDVVALSQSVSLKELAGQELSLKGKLYFEKLPGKKAHEIYLRIRQFSDLGFHSDLARVWVRVLPDRIIIQRWKNGTHEPPVTIKAKKRKWIDIESSGIVGKDMKRYEVFITAAPVGNKKLSDDSMRFHLSGLSARKVIPPALELSRLSRIWTTDSKHASFTAKVNPPAEFKQKDGQVFNLKVAIELYHDDMLMYRGEQAYEVGTKEKSCRFPTEKLSPGTYVLMFDLETKSGKNLASEVMEVEIISGPFSD